MTASSPSVTYGDAVPDVTPTYSGFVNGDSVADLSTTPTCSTAYTTTSGANTSPSTSCSGAIADNYAVTYTNGAVSIAKASQTITFANPAPDGATYGDAAIPVAPTSDSGLAVEVASNDDVICSVSGGGVNLSRAGTCTLTVSQDGNGNYLAASDVVRTFTIAKAAQATLTMTSASTAVFGETITLASSGGSGTGSVAYGVVAGTCTIRGGTTLTLGDAGSPCQVAATKQTDANHDVATSATQVITVTKAGQTLAFTSTVPTTPVSGDTYTPEALAISTSTAAASGVTPTFTASGTCDIADGVVTFVASGDCAITASAPSDTNFTAASDVTQTIAVGSINQNITFAQPSAVAFGSSSFALTATATSTLDVAFTLGAGTTNSACSVSSLGVVTIAAVGTCEVVAAQSGDDQYAAASPVTRAFRVEPALPTAPTLTSASASSQSITVGFTPPGFAGGVSILAYEVTATPTDGGTAIVDTACTASPCTITGLANGTRYTVAVAAINAVGTGPASSATGSLTPATAAFAVGAFSAVPGDTVVDLSWEALTTAQLGGGSFTRYEISYREAGLSPASAWTLATDQVTVSTTSAYQVTGLDNGTSYDFQIVAITSANSAELAGNTAVLVQYPSTVPSEPLNLSVLASTATDVEFSWEAPLSDGGSPVNGFVVAVTSSSNDATSPIACTVTGVTTNCTASNLSNGAVYEFTVEATNRMSSGANGVIARLTYNVPSSDSSLSSLVVTGGGEQLNLIPDFAASTIEYSVDVSHDVERVTITPTTTKDASTVSINGVSTESGSPSFAIDLDVGANEITLVVTASDRRYTTEYTVEVVRALPVIAVDDPVGEPDSETDDDDSVVEPAPPLTPPQEPTDSVIEPSPVPQQEPIGGDGEPLLVREMLLAASEGRAVYVDRDGSIQPATFAVRGAASANPTLVAGETGDLTMTVTGAMGSPASFDEETGNLVVNRGRQVVLSGSGHAPGSLVEVWLFSTPILLGEAIADTDGVWSLEVAIPGDSELGEHLIQIEGTRRGGEDRAIRATLVIADPAPATPLPETSDDSSLLNVVILFGLFGSVAALIAIGVQRRRNSNNEGASSPS